MLRLAFEIPMKTVQNVWKMYFWWWLNDTVNRYKYRINTERETGKIGKHFTTAKGKKPHHLQSNRYQRNYQYRRLVTITKKGSKIPNSEGFITVPKLIPAVEEKKIKNKKRSQTSRSDTIFLTYAIRLSRSHFASAANPWAVWSIQQSHWNPFGSFYRGSGLESNPATVSTIPSSWCHYKFNDSMMGL